MDPWQKNAVCCPNYICSRVIRSSPCWLSTLYDNRAIHRLTNIDNLSGREMCFGAEEEAGWVFSKPPKSPREDRRSFADVIFIPNHPNYRTIIVCLLAIEEILNEEQSLHDLLKHFSLHYSSAFSSAAQHQVTTNHIHTAVQHSKYNLKLLTRFLFVFFEGTFYVFIR